MSVSGRRLPLVRSLPVSPLEKTDTQFLKSTADFGARSFSTLITNAPYYDFFFVDDNQRMLSSR